MKDDPIVKEVRKIRDSHAAKFKYNLDLIFRDLKDKEKEHEVVSVKQKKTKIKKTGS